MTTTSIRLLSAVRRTKAANFLYSIPSAYFDEEEAAAFEYVRTFFETHQAWPSATTVRGQTGVQLVVTKEPVSFYLDEARKRALYNDIREPFADITEAIRNQEPDQAIQYMKDCIALSTARATGSQSQLTSYSESLGIVEQDYDVAKRVLGLRGIATGYPLLDEKTDGLQNANMYTIVARPGRGKTQKLITISRAAHLAGASVLFLSMEMQVLQLARRRFGLDAGIDPKFLRTGRLSTTVEREMRRQLEQLRDTDLPNFYWLAGNFKKSTEALEAACQQVEPDLIVADAAYLMKPSDRTKANAKHEVLSDVMESLADLSVRMNRPVAISVQFNRLASGSRTPHRDNAEEGEQRQHRNPLAHLDLAKIAGTDAIGQISSLVLGLDNVEPPHDRDERYAGILKSREGEDFGWYRYNYKFRPPNFSQIEDYRRYENGTAADAAPDLSYMDVQS